MAGNSGGSAAKKPPEDPDPLENTEPIHFGTFSKDNRYFLSALSNIIDSENRLGNTSRMHKLVAQKWHTGQIGHETEDEASLYHDTGGAQFLQNNPQGYGKAPLYR